MKKIQILVTFLVTCLTILLLLVVIPNVYDYFDTSEEKAYIEYCVYHKYYPIITTYEFCIAECYNLSIC